MASPWRPGAIAWPRCRHILPGDLLMRRVALATLQNAALPELERLLADEPLNPAAQARVGAIEPGDHTRMVAALRLAT